MPRRGSGRCVNSCSLPDAGVLTAINKRIGNILKKAPPDKDTGGAAAGCSAKTDRCRKLGSIASLERSRIRSARRSRRDAMPDTLKALIELRSPVDDFFERIMVMDENPERRANRLALLRDVQRLLGSVADLSRLPG